MQVIIHPSFLSGKITAPASKSAMQRACAAALLRKGKTILHNAGISADDKAALDIIAQLGAAVTITEENVTIVSNGIQPKNDQLNCGESGLSARMFTSIAALSEKEIKIDGSGSLKKRPFHFFDAVLPQLGVTCKTENGLLPLTIKGPLQPENICIDGSLSSQYLTGLLFAYAAANAAGVTIEVENLASKPYIDLTLQTIRSFGLKVPENNDFKAFHFDENPFIPNTKDLHFSIEGDWSGAAFLLVAGAINGDLEINGLDVFSTQADKAILQALMQAQAIISIEPEKITIKKSRLKAFHFNATDCPDLFPPLVALAAYCEGTSVIEGVSRLKHKESDRGLTLQEEFAKMNVTIQLQDDLMIIKGGNEIRPAEVHSRHDHRIAMACAAASLTAEGDVTIEAAEAVDKSYPQFWQHLQSIGAAVTLTNKQ